MQPCPASGFYCPGKAEDQVYGGEKPIIIPVGESTMDEEVAVVNKVLELDMDVADYDPVQVKAELALLYGVPEDDDDSS